MSGSVGPTLSSSTSKLVSRRASLFERSYLEGLAEVGDVGAGGAGATAADDCGLSVFDKATGGGGGGRIGGVRKDLKIKIKIITFAWMNNT